MNELGLFAGAGGGLLASKHLLGWRTRCAVEINPHCQAVLRQRQLDGALDPFPIWDDITTFDGRPWHGHIDVVSGGFPCQDISSAGTGRGLAGDRSGLWFEMLRVIDEVRPAYVFAENSPMLRTRGLDVVLGGLAELGFDAGWGVLGAHHVGAPHKRDRMWIVAAHPDRCRQRGLAQHAEVARAPSAGADDGNTHSQRQRRAEHEPTECANHTGAVDVTNPHGVELRQQPGRGSGAQGQDPTQPREDGCDGGTTSKPHNAGLEVRRGERGNARAQLAPAERGSASPRRDWWQFHRFAGVDDGVASGLVEHVAAAGGETQ